MSTENQQSCAFCKAYLFNDDDVVYCPVCGAPHHRECYNKIGHCALEELHGTENEYGKATTEENQSRESVFEENEADSETTVCQFCHESFPKTAPRCTKCGAPNMANRRQFVQFDFLGGVDKDQEIADGVTAEEAKQFVIVNTPRYIPKFLSFHRGKKSSWNWIAFLFPAPWLFSRKMYKNGIIAAIFTLIASIFTNSAVNSIMGMMQLPENYSQSLLMERLMSALPKMDSKLIIMMVLGFLITVSISVLTGIMGDLWYRRHAVTQIRTIRENSENKEVDTRKKGGVNFFSAVLCHMIINYATMIILSFI